MDVTEVKTRKATLEKHIQRLLLEFQETSGMEFEHIDFNWIQRTEEDTIPEVKIKMRIR